MNGLLLLVGYSCSLVATVLRALTGDTTTPPTTVHHPSAYGILEHIFLRDELMLFSTPLQDQKIR